VGIVGTELDDEGVLAIADGQREDLAFLAVGEDAQEPALAGADDSLAEQIEA
jgi:hypothetical protein